MSEGPKVKVLSKQPPEAWNGLVDEQVHGELCRGGPRGDRVYWTVTTWTVPRIEIDTSTGDRTPVLQMQRSEVFLDPASEELLFKVLRERHARRTDQPDLFDAPSPLRDASGLLTGDGWATGVSEE